MSISLILLIILILFLVGALPTWGHSRSWGYGPSGGIGLIVVILLCIQLIHLLVGKRRLRRVSAEKTLPATVPNLEKSYA